MSTVWVVGGRGFIGEEVVKQLKVNHQVITTSQAKIGREVEGVVHFSIPYDGPHFKKLFTDHKIDTVLFLSGNSYPAHSEHSPFYEIESTYTPFLSLAEMLRLHSPATKIWFASSVAVYGANKDSFLKEDSATLPLSFYGIAKQNLEEYAKYYSRLHNLKFGIFRIFSTFGPQLKRQLVYDLVNKMIANPEKISILGDGSDARDLSFVTDQARAICLIQEKVVPNGDIFNIGSGEIYTVNQIIQLLSEILKINPRIEYLPRRAFDGHQWCADITKLKSLGFNKQYDLRKGLELTVQEIQKILSHAL